MTTYRVMRRAYFLVTLMISALVVSAGVSHSRGALAEDAFFLAPIRQLELTAGHLPDINPATVSWNRAIPPVRVQLEGEGEAYVEPTSLFPNAPTPGLPSREQRVVIRAAADKDVVGTLFWPVRPGETAIVKFRFDRSLAKPSLRKNFHEIKSRVFERLLAQRAPGAAWFRHQIIESRQALGLATDDLGNLPPAERRISGTLDVDSTIDLFSGEQALHENLQLDRQLQVSEVDDATIEVRTLSGITIREFDWRPLVQGLSPRKDRLADYIPFDQHAIFFPSFSAMVATLDGLEEPGAAAWQWFETRAEIHDLKGRYERQLGLSTGGAARLVGPRLVRGVAVTGGDPYFRSGTDVAILFEAAEGTDAATLEKVLSAQIAVATQDAADVESSRGELSSVGYVGRRSPDRSVSSYVARVDDVVIVSNSVAQLRRVIDTAQGRVARLGALDEFKFFRDRYRLGDPNETALVVISDATIRRWCGPVWRIGASRRMRAAAIVAETQAAQLDHLVARSKESTKVDFPPLASSRATGDLTWTRRGVLSSQFGSLAFQTPIGELDVERVTPEEVKLYDRWRTQYQSYWSNFFDPIAIRIGAQPSRLAFDMTVMPLIDRTEYRNAMEVAGKSRILPDAGDRHASTLLQGIAAIDKDSKHWFVGLSSMLFGPRGSKGDVKNWLGTTATLYVDDDPVWKTLARATEEQLRSQENLTQARLPVALRIDITDQEALTAARMHFRRFIVDQLGIAGEWKTRSHRRQEYYVFAPTPVEGREPRFVDRNFQLFTLAAKDQWLISLNEPLVKRAIDRQLDRESARAKADRPDVANVARQGESPAPWLGEHLAFELSGQASEALRGPAGVGYGLQAQLASWSNLPILNEWKRRFPQEDPVALHERMWYVRLTCPGGGGYRWNEQYQTMESTLFGHPDQPRNPQPLPPIMSDLKRLGVGLTFENNGLRARGEWERNR